MRDFIRSLSILLLLATVLACQSHDQTGGREGDNESPEAGMDLDTDSIGTADLGPSKLPKHEQEEIDSTMNGRIKSSPFEDKGCEEILSEYAAIVEAFPDDKGMGKFVQDPIYLKCRENKKFTHKFDSLDNIMESKLEELDI